MRLTPLILVLAALPALVRADETPFAYTYTTDLLPAGAAEVEQWTTYEQGRPHETWNHYSGRTEFEYGVSDNLQVALMPNYDWVRVHGTSKLAGDTPTDSFRLTSIGSEIVWRLTSPYSHDFGTALYLEPAYGARFQEVEAKLLVDRHFLDDRLIAAVNLVLEYEWEKQDAGWHKGTELWLRGGLSYRLMPHWSAGAEFQAKREFDGIGLFQRARAAADSFTFGPVLHFAEGRWWASLGAQFQLPWAANLSGETGETVNGFAHEEPRTGLRLRLAYAL